MLRALFRFARVLPCAGLLLSVLFAARVHAETTLPNGLTIPRDSMNGETQLYTLFEQREENIDWIMDGFPEPNTFSPLCNFKATFLLKESSSSLAVGWYNVVAGATTAPAQSEIYEIVPAGSAVDTVIAGSDIRSDPNYAGGLIGFALKRNPPHFTEAKLNTVCTSCATQAPWILSVSYRSVKLPNAFYVAFEDGDTSASSFGNDGDYNDYVFLFEGLACAGDGEPCEVPDAQGVCSLGITECSNTGALECKPLATPSAERCDNLDNDCNGETDEGDGLCPGGEVCSRGQCVPVCGQSEFDCIVSPYTECIDGICIDPRCKDKVCEGEQICVEGECRAACDGVVCPVGRACRFGACVDPCAGVTCGEQRVCVDGACVLSCACAGCAAGTSCEASTGQCVDDDCLGTACGEGEYCADDGACSDACAMATCPALSTCEVGECVALPQGPGGSSGGGGAGGASAGMNDGNGANGGGAPNGGANGTDGSAAGENANGEGGEGGLTTKDGGGGCVVAAAPRGRGLPAWPILFLVGLFARRRLRLSA